MNPMYLRATRHALLVLVACALTPALGAQESPFSRTSVGQIASEVLDALMPPEKLMSRIPIGRRGIFFDYARTTAAFRRVGAPAISPSDLAVRATVKPGLEGLLDDCDQMGMGSCSRLGWSAYVWLEPVSATATEVVVWAHVRWPDRGTSRFEESAVPTGGATLTGYSTQVHLTRHANGDWKVNKIGKTIAA